MIEEHALLFFNKNTQRGVACYYIKLVHEAIKVYGGAHHKCQFIQAIKTLMQQEKKQHLIFCSVYHSRSCRFFVFYEEVLAVLSQDIINLNNIIERRKLTDKKRYGIQKNNLLVGNQKQSDPNFINSYI